MGNCMAPSQPKRPRSKSHSINREYTVSFAGQTPEEKDPQQLPSLSNLMKSVDNKETVPLRGSPNSVTKMQNQPQIDPLANLEEKQGRKGLNIRPTTSIFVPQNVQIEDNGRQSVPYSVRQSDVRTLFPNGIDQDSNKGQNTSQVQSPRKSTVTLNNFLQSNVVEKRGSAQLGEVPEDLPMNSVRRNPIKSIAKKPEAKPLSVIYSQNEMLESQTTTIIGQKTGEHEPSVAESGRVTYMGDNGEFKICRRGTT